MTNENAKPETRTIRVGEANGNETPKPPRWHRRMMEKIERAYTSVSRRTKMVLGATGLGITLLAAGCNGSADDNFQADVPTDSDGGTTVGVCGRGYVPSGPADLAVQEEDMRAGDIVSVADKVLYFKVFRVGLENWDGAIVDADGNIISSIRDPVTGEESRRVQTFATGEDAVFELPGGVRVVINECFSYVDEDGQRHGVFEGGFDRCMPVDPTVEGNFTRTSGTGTVQRTTFTMSQTGEEPTRTGADCVPKVQKLESEESTFTPRFRDGVMPYDETAVVAGRHVDLIESQFGFTIPHGKSLNMQNLPTGRSIDGAEGTSLENAGCENRDGTYIGRVNLRVPGSEVEVTEISNNPQVLYPEIGSTDGTPREAAFVLRGVNSDCDINVESLGNINRLRDAMNYKVNGNHPCDSIAPYCLPDGATADVAIDEPTGATRVRLTNVRYE